MLRGVIFLALVHFAGPDLRPRMTQVLFYRSIFRISSFRETYSHIKRSTFRTLGQNTILTSAQPPAANGNIYNIFYAWLAFDKVMMQFKTTILLSSGLWISCRPKVFTRLLKEAFGSFCQFASRFGISCFCRLTSLHHSNVSLQHRLDQPSVVERLYKHRSYICWVYMRTLPYFRPTCCINYLKT